MPFKSDAQRKYFNANRKKLEAQGVDVDEWNEASKGKKLPEKAPSLKTAKEAYIRAIRVHRTKRALVELWLQRTIKKAAANPSLLK